MIPIIFSTVTGNAFKLADGIKEAVPDYIGPYNISYIKEELINQSDIVVLVYWCNHGTADDATIELINKMHNKKILILGTLGADEKGPHSMKVRENVNNLVNKDNILLGHYLCRGSIDLKRTFKKTLIPEGEKGHLSKERFEKQKESLGHPNLEDINNGFEFVKSILA